MYWVRKITVSISVLNQHFIINMDSFLTPQRLVLWGLCFLPLLQRLILIKIVYAHLGFCRTKQRLEAQLKNLISMSSVKQQACQSVLRIHIFCRRCFKVFFGARICCKQHVLPRVPQCSGSLLPPSPVSQISPQWGSGLQSSKDNSRCNIKNMSYLFYALMIYVPTICIGRTRHCNPENSSVIRRRAVYLWPALLHKFLMSLNDSETSTSSLQGRKKQRSAGVT